MLSLLELGTVLQERYEIDRVLGSAETTAAYLVLDLVSQDQLLLWESTEIFALRTKPRGVRGYFEQEGKHYLVLHLANQSLAFLLTAAGRFDEDLAGLWLLSICRAIGYWHERQDREPLLILRQGALCLSIFALVEYDQVNVPSYGDFDCQVEPQVAADAYRFSAPETEAEELSPRSDVYALGAMLYCLLSGQPPPPPDLLSSRQEKLVLPRKINPDVSRDMDKIVRKAMQLDPRRRYATAAEMAADLEALLIPRLMETETEEKPSILMRIAPFVVAVTLLLCLAVVIEGLPQVGQNIDLSWLFGLRAWSTPESEARSLVVTVSIPTPDPAASSVLTATIIPASEIKVHQVRLAQYPQVVVYASVLDAEQEPVTALGRDVFRLSQDGADIPTFFVEDASLAREPLAVVVVVDTSRSMEGERLQRSRAAIANFVMALGLDDQVSLLAFDNQVELVREFTVNKAVIVEALDSLQTGGGTAMFDAVAIAAERLSAWPGRRAIVLLTDGRDSASTDHDAESAVAAANASSTPVFVVDLNKNQYDLEFLERIPVDTGGSYYWAPEVADLETQLQRLERQLQSYYRFQFTSQHLVDGSIHRIAIGFERGDGARIWGEKKYRSR